MKPNDFEAAQPQEKIMSTATITFSDNDSRLTTIYMESAGDPESVKKTLKKRKISTYYWADRNVLASDFLCDHRALCEYTRIGGSPNGEKVDYAYTIQEYNGKIYLYAGSKHLFSGNFSDFYNFSEKEDYTKYIDKVVRFNYKGGSHAGFRAIRVSDVTKTLIRGVDVVENKFKAYSIKNIEGKIQLVK